jgi:hypothetical protein
MENQERRESQILEESNPNIHKMELGVAVFLFAISLNPKELKAMDIYQESTPLISLRSYGPYMFSEDGEINTPPPVSAPFCYQEVVNENINMELMEENEMPFDSSVLGIENWKEMGMSLKNVELEEKGYTIQVSSDEAEVYSIPLLQSTFLYKRYNDKRPLKNFAVSEGMVYEILEKREIEGNNGETVNVGLISNNYLKQQALVIVMDAKDKYGGEKKYVTEVNGINQDALELSISDTYTLAKGDNVNTYQVNEEFSKQIDLLYNLEDLNPIQEYIENDEVVQSIIQLRDLFKEYDITTYDLSKYLKTTPWYEEMVQRNGKEITDKTIEIPYIVQISTQPLQCVGFVEMMEELYPELNMVDISSMETKNGAQSLIPRALLTYSGSEKPREVSLYQGGVGIGGNALNIEDYQRGDIFIINGGDFGHVGLILGKYEIKGRTVLLVADSNKLRDGMVRLYLVNDENIDGVLGEERYILRNK